MPLDTVKVLGVNETVTNVNVNGKSFSNFLYDSSNDVRNQFLVLDRIRYDMSPFSV